MLKFSKDSTLHSSIYLPGDRMRMIIDLLFVGSSAQKFSAKIGIRHRARIQIFLMNFRLMGVRGEARRPL